MIILASPGSRGYAVHTDYPDEAAIAEASRGKWTDKTLNLVFAQYPDIVGFSRKDGPVLVRIEWLEHLDKIKKGKPEWPVTNYEVV